MLGWLALGFLDFRAGLDVRTSGDLRSDVAPTTDQLYQLDLFALLLGVLVLAAIASLLSFRSRTSRHRVRALLSALALGSVLVLAFGGHPYALLVPVCLLAGAGGEILRDGGVTQPESRLAPPEPSQPSQPVAARRPSPRPRA